MLFSRECLFVAVVCVVLERHGNIGRRGSGGKAILMNFIIASYIVYCRVNRMIL